MASKREEFEAALVGLRYADPDGCTRDEVDLIQARVLALYDEAEKRVADLELDWNESQNEINSLVAKLDSLAAKLDQQFEAALYDEAERRRAGELAEQLSRSVGIELYDNLKADRDRLAARCEELAKRNTDGEEQRLADEQTIRNLTKRYDALAATVERVKALRKIAADDFKGYVLNTDLAVALAPQQEKE